MTKKGTKRALLTSALAIFMCVTMLIGTTFAWFTDTATTAVNKIQSGTLDVELYYKDADGVWQNTDTLKETSLGWVQATSVDGKTTIVTEENKPLWEPGCTFTLPELKIVNEGNLALKYKITISGITGNAKLLDVIKFTMTLDSSETGALGTEHKLAAKTGEKESANILTISGHMDEKAGNDYQNLSIDGIAITVSATQDTVEYDSYNNTYDKDAVLPVSAKAVGDLKVTKTDSQGGSTATIEVKEEQTLKDEVMTVVYKKGVKLVDSTTVSESTDGTEKKAKVKQELTYVNDTPSTAMADISVDAGKTVAQYDLTLPVADDNSVLVEVEINYMPGLTGVEIYHNGEKLGTEAAGSGERTKEYMTYNQENGKITLYLLHASPVDILSDKPGTKTVTTVDELANALADEEVSTVVLGNDITLEKLVTVDHDVTMDFNGKTLTAEGTAITKGQRAIDVKNGKLIFKDSSAEKAGKFVSAYGGVQLWDENPAFELNDITIECARSYAVQTGYTANAAVAVMNSGKIVGGAFNCNNRYWKSEVLNSVTINGGTIDATNADAFAGIYAGNCYTLTINDGEFIGDGQPSIINIGSYNPYDGKWTVNINNGKFTNSGSWPYNDFGGIISASTKEALGLKGGTFNVEPNYVVDGYQAVNNNDGTWTVKAE